MEIQAETVAAGTDDDRWEFADGKHAPADPMRQEARGIRCIPTQIRHVTKPINNAGRCIARKTLAVFVTDQMPGEVDTRERTGVMAWIRNSRMLQAEDDIAHSLPSLRQVCQGDPAPAVCSIVRSLVAVPHVAGRQVDAHAADCARDMAHVEPS